MPTEDHEDTQVVIVGSVNMGFEIYPTLPGFEPATCSVTSARGFPQERTSDVYCFVTIVFTAYIVPTPIQNK